MAYAVSLHAPDANALPKKGIFRTMKITAKIMSLCLALLVIFSALLLAGCSRDKSADQAEKEEHNAFIDKLGGVSETYTGSVSAQSYATNQEAATAYVEKEISGEQAVSVVGTVSLGTLSAKEINDLNIPDADSEGIVDVEQIEVEYQELGGDSSDEMSVQTLGTLNKTKKVRVYIIKYENDFKYYTPCPVTGETINKSYYDSVFNSEKYQNCTYNTTMTLDMDMDYSSLGMGTMTMTMTMSQTIYYSSTGILIEQRETTSMPALLGESGEEVLYAYIVKGEDDSLICYISEDNDEWYEGDLYQIGFSTMEELTPFYDQYLDYTYFTKTNYGFELSEENAAQYVNETLADTLGASTADGLGINMFAKYYVSEGVLSGMRMDMTMDMSEAGISVSCVAVGETSVTNYGTTVVEQPFED